MSNFSLIKAYPKKGFFKLQLTVKKIVYVDIQDASIVLARKWHAHKSSEGRYYARSAQKEFLHRVVLGCSKGFVVDHINGDTLDNRRSNLRIATIQQNRINVVSRRGKYLQGTRKVGKRWQAYIHIEGKQNSLGMYDTELEAHGAYLHCLKQRHGEFVPKQLEMNFER